MADADTDIARPLRLKSGVDWGIEDEADRMLAASRRDTTRAGSRGDYLSREQMALRQAKEVLNHTGVPDASLVCGIYRRAYNPLAGQRPTKTRHGEDG